MLTKKHYKRIARIIRNAKLVHEYEGVKAIELLESHLGLYFKEDNPRFDRTKFVESCRT